jgi:hypothetical protein
MDQGASVKIVSKSDYNQRSIAIRTGSRFRRCHSPRARFGAFLPAKLALVATVLALVATFGCANISLFSSASVDEVDPIRIGEILGQGDPARRASLRLVDEGLAAEIAGDSAHALARFERALQVDSTNPYAYLAMARLHIDAQHPEAALQFLETADSLLELTGNQFPETHVHIVGLRGGALYDEGQIDVGVELLERARLMAPGVWGDGVLSPEELRGI